MRIANIIGSNKFVTTVLLSCGHRRNVENSDFKLLKTFQPIDITCNICVSQDEENTPSQSSEKQVQNVLVINDGAADNTSNIGADTPALDNATEAASGDTAEVRE